MLVRTFEDYESMSRCAALTVAGLVQTKPTAVLGMPTGETPKGMFAELRQLHARFGLDLGRVRTFNLDEYVGVPGSDPRSFRGYMDEHFFRPVGFPAERIGFLDGTVADLAAECRRFDKAIEAAGGIDLIILGIGTNGHIAFNEPGEAFSKGTNVVKIAPTTAAGAVRDWGSLERVPPRAITMGVQTILRCRKVLLLASGTSKAAAVREALTGQVHPRCPATALQNHPDVELLLDRAAFAQAEVELPIPGVQVVRT